MIVSGLQAARRPWQTGKSVGPASNPAREKSADLAGTHVCGFGDFDDCRAFTGFTVIVSDIINDLPVIVG
jgi:hypothetical protein